jgi:Transposase, Mutator family
MISRLTTEWKDEYERWQKRDLSARRYVYASVDGVYVQARTEDHRECERRSLSRCCEAESQTFSSTNSSLLV